MAFTPNPFDMTGTVDTTGFGGPSLTWKGAHDINFNATSATEAGRGEGSANPEATVDTSVGPYSPAFSMTNADLTTAAQNRLRPTQRAYNRTY